MGDHQRAQQAVERERRRLLADRDAELLKRQPLAGDDFDDVAAYAVELDTGLQ